MYNVWTLKGTCTFVHIFVSKNSVNCVTKKEEIIIKKKHKKKLALPCIIKLFITMQEICFHFFRQTLNKTESQKNY